MADAPPRTCATCGAALAPGARYCARCGAAAPDSGADEVALPGGRRLRVSADSLSLRELLAVVESGVAFWRARLESAEGVARQQAAEAIKDLSQILDSLAEQIARGRETVRITGRLPAQRAYPRTCAVCGRGNRAEARYCIACGAALRGGPRPAQPPPAPPPLGLKLAARSDVGQTRAQNQDVVYSGEFTTVDGTIGTLLLVADGMGGQAAGDQAAQLATATFKEQLRLALESGVPADDPGWHDLLRLAVQRANRAVYERSRSSPELQGMGTTLTAAVVAERRVHIGHIGDTRAYLLNPAGVEGEGQVWTQLTTDHSIVARLVDIGQLTAEQARVHPQRNMLYRSLGGDPQIEVDTLSHALAQGDVLLLCSDGLDSYLPDDELARIALETPEPTQACATLIGLANQRGGRDNISVVIARVG